jgi:peptidoglycan/LPS O-acetylase OafA/YrhL
LRRTETLNSFYNYSSIENKKHIDKIDILRGIAILLVLLYHSQLVLFPHFEEVGQRDTKNVILNLIPTAYGWIGVQLFLVISGFLIHLGFLSRNGSLNLVSFYSRRFWRIYPPYLIFLLLFFATELGMKYHLNNTEALKDLFVHLLFIHTFIARYYFSINPSFWSLALEMQLYLIYPIFLFMRHWLGINITLFIILLLVPASYVVLHIILPNSTIVAPGFISNHWFNWCAGAFLAERYVNGQRLFGKFSLIVALAGFVATILAGYYISTELSAFISIIAWIAFFEWILHKDINTKTRFNKLLATIGLVSYSIYLIHQPLLHYIYPRIDFLGAEAYWAFVKFILIFIAIFIFSYLSYRFIELPSIRLGSFLRRNKKSSL